jgi:hypothetical protein
LVVIPAKAGIQVVSSSPKAIQNHPSPNCSRRGARKSLAPVRRREYPLDIHENPASPPARGHNEKAALRRLLFIQSLLLPGVQQNPLHPFGGANIR